MTIQRQPGRPRQHAPVPLHFPDCRQNEVTCATTALYILAGKYPKEVPESTMVP